MKSLTITDLQAIAFKKERAKAQRLVKKGGFSEFDALQRVLLTTVQENEEKTSLENLVKQRQAIQKSKKMTNDCKSRPRKP